MGPNFPAMVALMLLISRGWFPCDWHGREERFGRAGCSPISVFVGFGRGGLGAFPGASVENKGEIGFVWSLCAFVGPASGVAEGLGPWVAWPPRRPCGQRPADSDPRLDWLTGYGLGSEGSEGRPEPIGAVRWLSPGAVTWCGALAATTRGFWGIGR